MTAGSVNGQQGPAVYNELSGMGSAVQGAWSCNWSRQERDSVSQIQTESDPYRGKVLALRVSDHLSPSPTVRLAVPGPPAG